MIRRARAHAIVKQNLCEKVESAADPLLCLALQWTLEMGKEQTLLFQVYKHPSTRNMSIAGGEVPAVAAQGDRMSAFCRSLSRIPLS